MKTLTASGEHGASAPTLTISQRTTAAGRTEVHIIARADGEDSTKAVAAWFDRDLLLETLGEFGTQVRLAKEGA